jgi:hypothetical protein
MDDGQGVRTNQSRLAGAQQTLGAPDQDQDHGHEGQRVPGEGDIQVADQQRFRQPQQQGAPGTEPMPPTTIRARVL